MTTAPISVAEKPMLSTIKISKTDYKTGKNYYDSDAIKNGVDPLGVHSHSTIVLNENSKSDLPFRTQRHNRIQVVQDTSAPSCTDESFADSCDINMIVYRHQAGDVPLPSIDTALYNQDFTQDDFPAFAEKLNAAQSNFNTLPPALRLEFDNDVSKFATFLKSTDDETFNKLIEKHGLIKSVETPSAGVSPSEPEIQIKPTPFNPTTDVEVKS